MSIDVGQFREMVVRPVLQDLWSYTRAAEELLVGTALVESDLRYLRQLNGGPALGVYQMEPATHNDIVRNFLRYREPLRQGVLRWSAGVFEVSQLAWNLAYATAMARVHYIRVREELPLHDDVPALAAYWKQWYNTRLGSGTIEDFIAAYERGAR